MQISNLKKIGLFSIFSLMVAHQTHAQTTVTFQPGPSTGKDTYVIQQSTPPLGNDPTMKAGTNFHKMRALLQFDLTSIPPGSIITSAKLSLYGANGHVYNPFPNECILERIGPAWTEAGVNWVNQPGTTNTPILNLITSTTPTQNYLNISNIGFKNVIQNMVDFPVSNNGFMIKSVDEDHFKDYKLMQFATSEHPIPKMRPKLEITYEDAPPFDVCDSIIMGVKGKDVIIHSLHPNSNFGSYSDMLAMSWTFQGVHGDVHSLIEHDFSNIPTNAIVNSAELVLKGQLSTGNGSHYGSNSADLIKVGSSWEENTVTWNTAPTLTSWQISTPIKTGTQDHSFDITAMVQHMVNNPIDNNGWMLKLQTLQHYRSQVYGSGDNANPNYQPLIKICYTIPPAPPEFKNSSNEDVINAELSLLPNPTTDYVRVNGNILNNNVPTFINIYTLDGKQVVTNQILEESLTINLNHLNNGVYIVKLSNNGKEFTNKVIKR